MQENSAGSLKEQLAAVGPQLEELRQKKEERARQFLEVKSQISKICGEIAGARPGDLNANGDQDLSTRKLEEYHAQLQSLQKEKVAIYILYPSLDLVCRISVTLLIVSMLSTLLIRAIQMVVGFSSHSGCVKFLLSVGKDYRELLGHTTITSYMAILLEYVTLKVNYKELWLYSICYFHIQVCGSFQHEETETRYTLECHEVVYIEHVSIIKSSHVRHPDKENLGLHILLDLLFALAWQSDRLHKVLEFVTTVHELCAVLGMDFFQIVTDVHPSLDDSKGGQSKSISNDTLDRLAKTIRSLQDEKKLRIKKVSSLDFLIDGEPSIFTSHPMSRNFISSAFQSMV